MTAELLVAYRPLNRGST